MFRPPKGLGFARLVDATEQFAHLTPFQGTLVHGLLASVDRLRRLLAQTMGDLNNLWPTSKTLLAFCRKAGYLPELAWRGVVPSAISSIQPSLGPLSVVHPAGS